MKHIDLFAGIGGFSLAAKWMGWETTAFVEIEPFCQKILRKNFGQEIFIHDDIFTFDGKQFNGKCDILTGGAPCQPFSSSGSKRGRNDERFLFPEMLRIVREAKPRWVIAENVRGLLSNEGGLVFDEVCADLERQGYAVQSITIPACAVNTWHRRERVWIVGRLGEVYSNAQNPDRGRSNGQDNGGRRDSQIGGLGQSAGRLQHRGIEPGMARVGYGIPYRLDRHRTLGNAVVPQVVYEIYRAIEAAEGK